MRKEIVLVTIFIVVLMGVFVVAFKFQRVKAGEGIYIRAARNLKC